jgi:hypothetical protein
MASGKEPGIRARVADARDRIDGQIADAVPQQILVQEISVEQNGLPGGCGQFCGSRPGCIQPLNACGTACRVAPGRSAAWTGTRR